MPVGPLETPHPVQRSPCLVYLGPPDSAKPEADGGDNAMGPGAAAGAALLEAADDDWPEFDSDGEEILAAPAEDEVVWREVGVRLESGQVASCWNT